MRKGTLSRLAALALGLTLALVLAEGLLRIVDPWVGRHSDTMFTVVQFDPDLGWKMRPGISALVSFVDREDIPVKGNRWGFWDENWSRLKAQENCRVAVLGDSFTWGMGVEQSQRFTDLLARMGPHMEVMNFGMPGYGTDQALLTWRGVTRQFHPDVVVLTVYQNDFPDNHFEIRNGRAKPYFVNSGGKLELRNYPVPDWNFWQTGVLHRVAPPYRGLYPQSSMRRDRGIQWLAKNSDLVRMVYTLSRALPAASHNPGQATPASGRKGPQRVLTRLQQAQTELLTDLVAELHREVLNSGGKLLVVLAGDSITQFRAARLRFEAESVPFLDATTEVLATGLKDQPVYFAYNKHWTPAAHTEVARRLQSRLEREMFCPGAVAEAVSGGGQ